MFDKKILMIKEKLYNIEDIDVDRILVRARAGAEISNCIREATLIALSMGADVDLVHNNKTYWIRLADIAATIKEATDK